MTSGCWPGKPQCPLPAANTTTIPAAHAADTAAARAWSAALSGPEWMSELQLFVITSGPRATAALNAAVMFTRAPEAVAALTGLSVQSGAVANRLADSPVPWPFSSVSASVVPGPSTTGSIRYPCAVNHGWRSQPVSTIATVTPAPVVPERWAGDASVAIATPAGTSRWKKGTAGGIAVAVGNVGSSSATPSSTASKRVPSVAISPRRSVSGESRNVASASAAPLMTLRSSATSVVANADSNSSRGPAMLIISDVAWRTSKPASASRSTARATTSSADAKAATVPASATTPGSNSERPPAERGEASAKMRSGNAGGRRRALVRFSAMRSFLRGVVRRRLSRGEQRVDRPRHAVAIVCRGAVRGGGEDRRRRVAHRDPDAGRAQHGDVVLGVADRGEVRRRKAEPRGGGPHRVRLVRPRRRDLQVALVRERRRHRVGEPVAERVEGGRLGPCDRDAHQLVGRSGAVRQVRAHRRRLVGQPGLLHGARPEYAHAPAAELEPARLDPVLAREPERAGGELAVERRAVERLHRAVRDPKGQGAVEGDHGPVELERGDHGEQGAGAAPGGEQHLQAGGAGPRHGRRVGGGEPVIGVEQRAVDVEDDAGNRAHLVWFGPALVLTGHLLVWKMAHAGPPEHAGGAHGTTEDRLRRRRVHPRSGHDGELHRAGRELLRLRDRADRPGCGAAGADPRPRAAAGGVQGRRPHRLGHDGPPRRPRRRRCRPHLLPPRRLRGARARRADPTVARRHRPGDAGAGRLLHGAALDPRHEGDPRGPR